MPVSVEIPMCPPVYITTIVPRVTTPLLTEPEEV